MGPAENTSKIQHFLSGHWKGLQPCFWLTKVFELQNIFYMEMQPGPHLSGIIGQGILCSVHFYYCGEYRCTLYKNEKNWVDQPTKNMAIGFSHHVFAYTFIVFSLLLVVVHKLVWPIHTALQMNWLVLLFFSLHLYCQATELHWYRFV